MKAVIGLATAAIFSAVAAHQPSSWTIAGSGGHGLQAGAADAFPILAKGDRLGPPAAQVSITIERRSGDNTSVLIRMAAPHLTGR